jgi:hypothetical protein
MEELNNDLFKLIAFRLSQKSICELRGTCKKFNKFTKEFNLYWFRSYFIEYINGNVTYPLKLSDGMTIDGFEDRPGTVVHVDFKYEAERFDGSKELMTIPTLSCMIPGYDDNMYDIIRNHPDYEKFKLEAKCKTTKYQMDSFKNENH